MKPLDITGQVFNRLTAIKRSGSTHNGKALWLFKCECGKETTTCASLVKKGATKSCGCLGDETRRENGKKTLGPVSGHGMHGTPEYYVWKTMRQRCNNPNSKDYPDYGGRGIRICLRWNDFRNFHEDMGYRPSGNHSIDRIDVNLGYSPDNCKWSTAIEQANNRRPRSCSKKSAGVGHVN